MTEGNRLAQWKGKRKRRFRGGAFFFFWANGGGVKVTYSSAYARALRLVLTLLSSFRDKSYYKGFFRKKNFSYLLFLSRAKRDRFSTLSSHGKREAGPLQQASAGAELKLSFFFFLLAAVGAAGS